MSVFKVMKLLIKRKRMTREQKIASLKDKMNYIEAVLIPKLDPSKRDAASKKIRRKYDDLMKKVRKGK